jgi:hypothetical protein
MIFGAFMLFACSLLLLDSAVDNSIILSTSVALTYKNLTVAHFGIVQYIE